MKESLIYTDILVFVVGGPNWPMKFYLYTTHWRIPFILNLISLIFIIVYFQSLLWIEHTLMYKDAYTPAIFCLRWQFSLATHYVQLTRSLPIASWTQFLLLHQTPSRTSESQKNRALLRPTKLESHLELWLLIWTSHGPNLHLHLEGYGIMTSGLNVILCPQMKAQVASQGPQYR